MEIFFLVMGALVGSFRAAWPARDRQIPNAIDDAWLSWHKTHDIHALTPEEQVYIDQLRESGSVPPGWTWQPVREHAFTEERYRLLPPGIVSNREMTTTYRLFDPRVVIVDAHNCREQIHSEWYRRTKHFKIFRHATPKLYTSSETTYRFGPIVEYDKVLELGSAGFALATSDYGEVLGLQLIQLGPGEDLDRQWDRAVCQALHDGYMLVHAGMGAANTHWILIHPVPNWTGEGPSPLGRHEESLRIWDLQDEAARQRLRLGLGPPLYPEQEP